MSNRSKPQYAVVADVLIRDIANETHPVGSLLPPELELAERFGVSRNTMRTAMRMLVDMGLVSRRAGMGTLVQARHATPNFVQTIESLDQLFPGIQATELRLLETRSITADDTLALLLACRTGEEWIRFTCIREQRRPRSSLSYVHIYVPPAYAKLGPALDKRREPEHECLEAVFGRRVVEVVQQSDVASMPDDAATALSISAGSPALRTVRRFAAEDSRILMVTDTLTPPGQQGFTIRLRSNWVMPEEEAA